jgi:2-keto-myo-inositol isomerase
VTTHLTRREVLALAGASVSAGMASTLCAAAPAAPAANRAASEPFGYSLNFSTIRTAEGGLVQEIEIAAKAGYQGIEPWIGDLDQYVKKGGSLRDVDKRIRDLGLSVENAIGFFEWIVDDDQRRAKAFEEVKRNMDLAQQIGCKRLAAPPAGATGQDNLNLLKAADRYRALLELGDKVGVVPQLEIWGGSKTLHTLGEAMLVAVESRHPKACILPDVFHVYKGGSDFSGLGLLSATAIGVFHVNDYPANPPRAQITDAQRVFPGDGIAPLASIFRDLAAIGYRGMLSLELFNRDYWKQDPLTVARTGLEKMKAAVAKSKTL